MGYPNLKLIEQTFKEKVKEKYPDVYTNPSNLFHRFTADLFEQTWLNTGTGFDLGAACTGQGATHEYTTVIELQWLELVDGFFHPNRLYGIFFGDRFAYMLRSPNQKFMNDLKVRNMNSQKNARLYVDDEFREHRELSF